MLGFHKHNWVETERFFSGCCEMKTARNLGDLVLKQLLFGVTTIVQQCSFCHQLRTTEILGKVSK